MSENWFQRITKGIRTSKEEKKEVPEGLWYQCPKCKTPTPQEEHKGKPIRLCAMWSPRPY
jgi:acetyl-CoA carboxylase carboxyl transferase subunit beta